VNHHVTVNISRIGTNHSSHAEKSMRNKFASLIISKKINILCLLLEIFVCVVLISVKSKYGSCSGSCTGIIEC
jgi:hypothetical protein